MLIKIYYSIKPLIPRSLQILLRRGIARWKRSANIDIWPIDKKASWRPEGWIGWPQGKKFAFVITHDVETEVGHNKCHQLIKLEEEIGFRSSFNFVPKRYHVSRELCNLLTDRGFEVGVHGLYHDGKYYFSKKIFDERAVEINKYLKEWGSVGFRSPSMLNNLDWIGGLNIEYDASTFDTDPFEPQPIGLRTIFPFYVGVSNGKGFVELPYTLPQDFTLFVLLKEKNIEIWKKKLDWIVENGGMALLITHPDYMNFYGGKIGTEEYPASNYEEFLKYVKSKYEGQYWHALPKEIARFWKRN